MTRRFDLIEAGPDSVAVALAGVFAILINKIYKIMDDFTNFIYRDSKNTS